MVTMMPDTPSQFRKKYHPLIDVDVLEWLDKQKAKKERKVSRLYFWLDVTWNVCFWISVLLAVSLSCFVLFWW